MALFKIRKKIHNFSAKNVIYANTHDFRWLPYSVVFDILSYFRDAQLNQRIRNALRATLPHRDDYVSDSDLWMSLAGVGNLTLVQARALATIVAHYMHEQSKPVVISLSDVAGMTCENEIFLYFFLELAPRTTVMINAINAAETLPDSVYLEWFDNAASGYDDYTRNTENILRHAWYCAELGAEEMAFRIMENGIRKSRVFYLKQIYLLQLQFMRIATQHYAKAADEAREIAASFHYLAPAFYVTKAWGNLLIRREATARQYFEMSGMDMRTLPLDNESFHRLNSYALLQHFIERMTWLD